MTFNVFNLKYTGTTKKATRDRWIEHIRRYCFRIMKGDELNLGQSRIGVVNRLLRFGTYPRRLFARKAISEAYPVGPQGSKERK